MFDLLKFLVGELHYYHLNPPSKIEIYNDINDNLVNFFRQVKDNTKEMFKKLLFLPHSLTEYYNLREQLENDGFKDNINRAIAFFFVNRHAFSGMQRKAIFAITGKTDRSKPNQYFQKVNELFTFAKRMRHWTIENRDFEVIFDKYDTENTFFYCDPPYFKVDVGYRKDFTEEDHLRLANRVKSSELKGKVMLSYGDNEKIRKLYPNLNIIKKKFKTHLTHVKEGQSRNTRTELLIMNYDIKKEGRFSGKHESLMKYF